VAFVPALSGRATIGISSSVRAMFAAKQRRTQQLLSRRCRGGHDGGAPAGNRHRVG
jgi:hypothetical protein